MSATTKRWPFAPRLFAAFYDRHRTPVFCLLSKQKIDIQVGALDASGLTIRQESIPVDTTNATNLNFYRGFSNRSKNFFKVFAGAGRKRSCSPRKEKCISVSEAEIRDAMSTYRARDRGGAASVPRRRRDVNYMLSSGRPRVFVGWCLPDRHEKGIAS
ncbi:PREDICTED: uncharacterized protein LOC105565837 [Vollenhovia emeryi]|uniref:uncharacterized protein LOC105565837 n=1 Tax=Vollenhovia emeryi TaxID=411798 RepID=UPI0005F4C2B5|nr:PREDICTED: uncharacterized protein LOC105565837 [Vollenhovia emeryi]